MDRKHSTLIEIGVWICVHGFYPLLGIMLWALDWVADEYSHTILGTVISVVLHIFGAMLVMPILAIIFSPVLILLAIVWETFFRPNHRPGFPYPTD